MRSTIQPQPFAADLPRYTACPLPPYRYVPGGPWPHPMKDPTGHMHGKTASDELIVPPHRWHEQHGYLLGVDLFNHAFWWEAHEAWEDIWKRTTNHTQRNFLHGLIHLAAALLKWHLRNQRGVRVLINRCHGKLDPIAETCGQYMGLSVTNLLTTINHAELEKLPETPKDPVLLRLELMSDHPIR